MKNRNFKDGDVNRNVIAHSEYGALTDYVIAQAKHESANFSSKVYKKNNNAFGMKNGSTFIKGESVGSMSPEGNTYARYESDTVSFKDYLRWLRARKFPLQVDNILQFAQELRKRGYYTDSVENYSKGLAGWMK